MTIGNRGWQMKLANLLELIPEEYVIRKVLCVYPRVDMKCEEVSFYSGGTLPLRVKPQIVIDIG